MQATMTFSAFEGESSMTVCSIPSLFIPHQLWSYTRIGTLSGQFLIAFFKSCYWMLIHKNPSATAEWLFQRQLKTTTLFISYLSSNPWRVPSSTNPIESSWRWTPYDTHWRWTILRLSPELRKHVSHMSLGIILRMPSSWFLCIVWNMDFLRLFPLLPWIIYTTKNLMDVPLRSHRKHVAGSASY